MTRERQNEIVKIIRAQHTIKNKDIMEKFSVSIETVRRDLAYLEKKGLLKRVYGGAVSENFLNTEPEYASRQNENMAEKLLIADAAQKLIGNKDNVFFDIGTTLLMFAEGIDPAKKITAFTNSLRVAMTLCEKDVDVILSGGKVRNGEFCTSGAFSRKELHPFNYDKAVIGLAGINDAVISDFILEEADLRREIIKNSRTVIALADFTKFGTQAVCNICEVSDIDVLVTDSRAPVDVLKKIEKKGVEVIIAK